jgi:alpha-tubulin suppressor-like RCC1 family protein
MKRLTRNTRVLVYAWCGLYAPACASLVGVDFEQAQPRPPDDHKTDAAQDAGADRVIEIASGGSHGTCARTLHNRVYCWGANSAKNLGVEEGRGVLPKGEETALSPALAMGLSMNHTCIVALDHTVRCVGWNRSGELGDGTTEDRSVLTKELPQGTSAARASCTNTSTCIIDTAGKLRCHGKALSNPDALGPVRDVVSGFRHACAITERGDVWCWGGNEDGLLGNGTTDSTEGAVRVERLPEPTFALALGATYTCALTTSHKVFCWGARVDAEDGDVEPELFPTHVAVGTATAIAATSRSACAVIDGGVRCWGADDFGLLGRVPHGPSPIVDVPNMSGVVALAGGDTHMCALTASGDVFCWGDNRMGELGSGTTDKGGPTPRRTLGLPGTVP